MGSMTSYRATSYQYDANYNRTSLQDGQGNSTSYTYDNDNRLTEVATGGATTSLIYDDVGNRTQKTLPNGAYTSYTYNSRNWLTNLYNRKSDATLISSYAYGHDYVGNRTSMTEANGDVTSYAYDNVYRLGGETKRDSGNNMLYRYQYTHSLCAQGRLYDGVGNRVTMTRSTSSEPALRVAKGQANTGQVSYTYDANNKLTQLVGPGGTTTFGYDNNGNTIRMTTPTTTWNYGYDYENRLVSATDNVNYTAAYTYAGDGLRLRVQESNNPNPDRWFQYDGVRPVLEGTLSGNTFTTVNRYAWEGDFYYDPLVFACIGGSNRYYLYDALGSTRQLVEASQTVTDSYSYEAFGNLMGSTGSTANPYRYVGSLGYYQTGSSLMHLGARYYMPEVGRFVQRDQLRGASPYVYVDGRPTLFADPNGEFPFIVIPIVIGGGVVIWQGYECVQAARWWAKCFDLELSIARDIRKQYEDIYMEHCRTDKDIDALAWQRANRTKTCRTYRDYEEKCWIHYVL